MKIVLNLVVIVAKVDDKLVPTVAVNIIYFLKFSFMSYIEFIYVLYYYFEVMENFYGIYS
jgi:hypothetical protein